MNVLQVPLSTNVWVLIFQILVDSFAWQEEILKDYLFDIILILQKAYTEGSYIWFWHNFLVFVSLIACSE